ncbi:MAG TPA: anti-sigma factor, partial [Micromonosporaceae bacterium]|nr:anti-sigma factor [Micromonosporaceae bacterium]
AYQLWRLKGLSATDAGLLEPGRNGGGRLVIGLSGVDAIAVTLEPAAGSTAPTTTPLANLPLS